MSDREIYMQEALRLAEEAAACGDVPVRAAAGVWMTAHCL